MSIILQILFVPFIKNEIKKINKDIPNIPESKKVLNQKLIQEFLKLDKKPNPYPKIKFILFISKR